MLPLTMLVLVIHKYTAGIWILGIILHLKHKNIAIT